MIERKHKTLLGETGAIFSDCERYRYKLWRRWDDFPLVNFLMLNPSTADELANDPTVQRCENRAKAMGFGGLIVTNLFAFRATQPADMKAQVDPVGAANNNQQILQAADESKMVVCAWGKDGRFKDRDASVLQMLIAAGGSGKLHALKINGDGTPMHPLYVSYSCQPTPYTLQ